MYCENCSKNQDTYIVNENKVFKVKGESIPVVGDVLYCSGCDEELFDEELDGKLQDMAFDVYRKRHGLLRPEEIARIRKSYNLSASDFAQSLGMGAKTVTRYELGSLQNSVANTLMVLAQCESVYRQIYEMNRESIPEEVRARIDEKLFGKRSLASNIAFKYRRTRVIVPRPEKTQCEPKMTGATLTGCYNASYLEYAYAG